MSEVIENCPQCTEEVTAESDFCPHCGILFETAGSPQCQRHPDAAAIGVCIIDREPGCDRCLKSVQGKFLCVEHRAVEVRQDWASVFASNEINEAELVRVVLKENGVTVLEQNFNSVGFVLDGGGDSPISRSNLNKAAKVFVPIPEFLNAKRLIDEWASGVTPIEDNEILEP